jgi:hypothetical protein
MSKNRHRVLSGKISFLFDYQMIMYPGAEHIFFLPIYTARNNTGIVIQSQYTSSFLRFYRLSSGYNRNMICIVSIPFTLREEAQDQTLWRTQFASGYGPVTRQSTT